MSVGAVTLGGFKEPLKNALKKLGLYNLAARIYSGLHSARKVPGAVRAKLDNRRLRSAEFKKGLPVPEPELLHLVAGTTDVRWFLHAGKLGFDSIVEILRKNGIALTD